MARGIRAEPEVMGLAAHRCLSNDDRSTIVSLPSVLGSMNGRKEVLNDLWCSVTGLDDDLFRLDEKQLGHPESRSWNSIGH